MSNSDSELEEDEEEILVYVEFDNCASNEVFNNQNLKLDMLGLDSEHPVMQVNGKFFEGTYEDAVGTYLFFDKDPHPTIDDPVFDKIPTLKYLDKTRKVLKMQRTFILPRYEMVGESGHSKSIPSMETIKEAGVPPKYQDQALAFWEDSRNRRIQALHEYLKKQEFRRELRLRGFEPDSASDEDSPFAMYKYESELGSFENNENSIDSQIENLENTLQKTELDKEKAEETPKKLTVIDPGPSTSKCSIPWVDDETPDEKLIKQKVKSVNKIRERTVNGKVQKKIVKKKRLSVSQKNSEKNTMNTSKELLDKESEPIQIECNKLIKDFKNDDNIKDNLEISYEKATNQGNTEEMEVDEMVVEENDKLLLEEVDLGDSCIIEKKRRKQEKREAKMREISEKIKSLSQNSSQPNS